MDIGKRLTQLRKEKGLTTNKPANMAGVSQSHLREIELGKRNPTVEILSYFCDALDISLSNFFKEDNADISPALLTAIEKLNSEQQKSLSEFIETMFKQ